MIPHRRSGLTTRASSVPRSRSRTTATAMMVMVVCMRRAPMRPGTMKRAVSWSGLYQARTRTSSGIGARPDPPPPAAPEALGKVRRDDDPDLGPPGVDEPPDLGRGGRLVAEVEVLAVPEGLQ